MKLYKRVKFIITRPYYWIRTSWLVWFYFLNREGRALYLKNRPNLNAVQQRSVNDLFNNGFSVTNFSELIGDESAFLRLRDKMNALTEAARVKMGKSFLLDLWEENPKVDFQDPFWQFAFDPKIVDVVNSYMQMYAKFLYASLHIIIPVSRDVKPTKSQRWHRDPDDKKLCKVFLYLNDVDESAGPFKYVAKSQYGGRWWRFFSQRPPKGIYPPEGAVERRILAEDIKSMTGRAGTIIFCDTSGLHKGGYATNKERFMFTVAYTSAASLWHRAYRLPDNITDKITALTPANRYALDL